MSNKPNKTLERVRSSVDMQEHETYVGAFMARTGIKWWWFFLIGPLAAFTMKQYQVVVTNKRVIFGRLSIFGAPVAIDSFAFREIRAVILKRGLLTYKIGFVFNERHLQRLNLNANHKAVKAMEGFLFDEQMGDYLQKAVA